MLSCFQGGTARSTRDTCALWRVAPTSIIQVDSARTPRLSLARARACRWELKAQPRVSPSMPPSPDRNRRALVTFFAVVFGATWLLQLPAILVQRGYLAGPIDRYVPLVVLGYFVPAIAALVLSRRALGGRGVRALLQQFGARRLAPGWYLLAFTHAAAILIAGMSLARLLGGPHVGSPFYPPTAAQIAAMVVIPFTEQIPWRGFAYPPIERRLGPLGASLVVGAAWALFHLQKQSLLGPGLAVDVALWMLLLMTAGTVVFTWFYRRTGSMLLVVVANAGIYLNNSTQALPANATPLAVHALGYCAVALALILIDRAAWRASMPSAAGLP
jgi:membrane protease YdiL (CAAX protease family)